MKLKISKIIWTLIITSFITSSVLHGQNISEIDAYASYISQRYNIPGMSIGVIREGKIVHEGYYGTYDLESKTSVDKTSLFNLHSLSKVFVNVAIFKLIEGGQLKLEDEVSQYIKDYPSHWEATQIQHLLSHSSGLPNIIWYFDNNLEKTKTKLYSATSLFEPGTDSDYNQTNYWLLNRIIDSVTDEGFDDTIRKQINSSSSKKLIFDHELVDGNGQPKEYRPSSNNTIEMEYSDVSQFMNGAGGVNITLGDFINWNQKLDNDKLISPSSKEKMWSPFTFKKGQHEFAHGWGIYHSNGATSKGFSGGGVAGLRKFVKEDLTVIVLTNGYQYGFNVNTFINWIAAEVNEELSDPAADLHIELYDYFTNNSVEKAIQLYDNVAERNTEVDLDPILNSLGYELLAKGTATKALAVFNLNTKEHPYSWNAWDSLAEGYELTGDTSNAIKNYKKSLEMNSSNTHAVERLEILEARL